MISYFLQIFEIQLIRKKHAKLEFILLKIVFFFLINTLKVKLWINEGKRC